MFSLFKKNKIKLTKEQQKLDQIWSLWEEGQADSPYSELMTYQSEVGNGGHDQVAKVEDCNSFIPSSNLGVASRQAPIAQLDRVSDYESEGWGFESLWAHHTTICGIIAQLGEHLPYKQGVTGSSPVNPTSKTFSEFSLKVFLISIYN